MCVSSSEAAVHLLGLVLVSFFFSLLLWNSTRKTCALAIPEMVNHSLYECKRTGNLDDFLSVTRRKQQSPGIASNDSTTHVPTARSSADPTKPTHTPYSNMTHPRKRENGPTNGPTQCRIKSTHTRLTCTGTRPHAPGHQAGDPPAPAHTERHNPSKVWTQQQARSPPRAVWGGGALAASSDLSARPFTGGHAS